MAEILTESFCERCGSRYTFESAVPRARLRGVKVLSRGLKNFVLDDKTSIDEAMAAARDDTDRALTAQQLEAFHKTFNFCMQCRQYICPNCWNDGEGRCLTCAPMLGRGILPAPFPHLDPSSGIAAPDEDGLAAAALATNGHAPAAEPSNGFDAIARLDALGRLDEPGTATELIGTSEADAGTVVEPVDVEPEVVESATPEPPSASLVAEAPTAEPIVEPAVERVLFDPYDPSTHTPVPPPVVELEPMAAVPEVSAEPVVDAPEVVAALEVPAVETAPEVVAEPAVNAEAPAVEPTDDAVTTIDPLIAGLRPGESLDEAIAAYESAPTELDEAETGTAALQPTEPEIVEPEIVAAEVIEPEVVDPQVTAPEVTEPQVVAAEVVEPEIVTAGALDADALADLPWAPAVLDVSGSVETPLPPRVPAEDQAAAIVVEPLDALPASEDLLIDASAPIDAPVLEPVTFVEPLDEIPTGDAGLDEPDFGVPAEAELPWPAAALTADADSGEPLESPIETSEPPALDPADLAAAAIVAAAIEAQTVEPAPVVEPVVVEPVVVEPAAVEPAPEPEPAEIAAAAAPVDIVAQPTWSIVAPDHEPVPDIPLPVVDGPSPAVAPAPPVAHVSPAPAGEPSWPAQPQWPTQQPSPGLPFLGRPAVPTGGVDALWAESDRVVSAPRGAADKPAGGVQPCLSCGLSLSASARFCRRCGTSQVG